MAVQDDTREDEQRKLFGLLKPEGEGTKLHLEHSGIANYPGDDAIKMFESFSGGWQGCVNQLQDYLKN